MGFCELLTLVFVAAKLFGAVDWSWWIVFLPVLMKFAIFIAMLGLMFLGQILLDR